MLTSSHPAAPGTAPALARPRPTTHAARAAQRPRPMLAQGRVTVGPPRVFREAMPEASRRRVRHIPQSALGRCRASQRPIRLHVWVGLGQTKRASLVKMVAPPASCCSWEFGIAPQFTSTPAVLREETMTGVLAIFVAAASAPLSVQCRRHIHVKINGTTQCQDAFEDPCCFLIVPHRGWLADVEAHEVCECSLQDRTLVRCHRTLSAGYPQSLGYCRQNYAACLSGGELLSIVHLWTSSLGCQGYLGARQDLLARCGILRLNLSEEHVR